MGKNRLKTINNHLKQIAKICNNEESIATPHHYQVGVDLGTADIQTIVVDAEGVPIAAFLDWADVVKDGVVVDYYGACQIVKSQLDKVNKKLGVNVSKAITSYPPGTDSRISINVVESAGVTVTDVIDEPTSVAILLQIENGAVVDIGGGTTGTAIIANNNVVASFDEATGGRHVSLTIAGGLKISLEEAEKRKKSTKERKLLGQMVKPVVENMASIVKKHIEGHNPKSIYLTGGGCLIDGFTDTFKDEFLNVDIVEFKYALYLTPLAIASYKLNTQT